MGVGCRLPLKGSLDKLLALPRLKTRATFPRRQTLVSLHANRQSKETDVFLRVVVRDFAAKPKTAH